jgi:nitrite transporter NirC
MPIPLSEALDDQAELAATKARQARDLLRYLWTSMLAGVYVGFAVVLLVSVSAPLVAAKSPAAKLVQGSVFGIALTLVVFAGAELFTGNVMVMFQGWWARTVRPAQVFLVLVMSLIGNVVGSMLFAVVVRAGGTLTGPGDAMLASVTVAKDAADGGQLFWRAVLCNALVCLAMWMAARTRSDGAKLAVLWWALLAFVGSGFEHSIANATIFTLAALDGSIGWGALVRNLALTVPGNIVGGGLVIGVGYAWADRRRTSSVVGDVATPADLAGAASGDPIPSPVAALGAARASTSG